MRGIILINTGSPDSFHPDDVGHYLTQFLTDERIIDLPNLQRNLLVRGIIVPFRKYKSAKAYQSVWTDNGAPLIVNSLRLAEKVEQYSHIPCEAAMRYGSLTVEKAIDRLSLKVANLSEIVLLPLFPHFAMSSYESAALHAQTIIASKKLKCITLPPFYGEEWYIDSLANLFTHIDLSAYQHILFTYHSIPLRQLRKSLEQAEKARQHEVDYRYQTYETSRLVAEKVGMPSKFSVSYQSAIGKSWLGPTTNEILQNFPAQGIKRLIIISPAFVADNLETIKDIDREARSLFLKAGGEEFCYIPCLNDRDDWAAALSLKCHEL